MPRSSGNGSCAQAGQKGRFSSLSTGRATLLIVAVIAAVAVWEHADELARLLNGASPGCCIRRATGLRCPACGLTHATVAFLQGHPAEALRYNWFLLPTLLFFAQELIVRTHRSLCDRSSRFYRYCYLPSVALYGVSVILWVVLRNLIGC